MYNICPIFIIIYQVPNKSIIHDRYLTTQYVCDMCMICIVYVPVFLHSYYTYQIPDTCAVVKYHTHIMYMSHTYQVPDTYPIASISTSVCTLDIILAWLYGRKKMRVTKFH